MNRNTFGTFPALFAALAALAAQPGQPATIAFERVIQVMARAGVHT